MNIRFFSFFIVLIVIIFMGLKPEKKVCLIEESFLDTEEPFLERILTISTEEEWQGKFIGKINDVLVVQDSLLVVADASNMRICIFDFEGELDNCFGGIGRGPGEFENVNNLIFDADENQLGVYDSKLKRLSWFDGDSNDFLRSISLKGMISDIYLAENEDLFVSKYVFTKDGNFVDILSSTGTKKQSILPVTSETEPSVMSGNSVKIAGGDALYFLYPYPYLVSVLDKNNFKELKTITFKKEGFKEPGEASRGSGGAMMGASMPSKLNNVQLSGDGSLVVESQIEEDCTYLDFFSPKGAYRNSIKLPEEHELAYYYGDNFLVTFIRGNKNKLAEITFWKIKVR